MSDIVSKWIETFKLNDESKEPLHYELCSDLLRNYDKMISGTIVDYSNESEITRRVTDETERIREDLLRMTLENDKLLENMKDKSRDIRLLTEEVSSYRDKLTIERESIQDRIAEAIRMKDESQQDFIRELKNDKLKLEDRYKLLESTLDMIKESMIKNETNSSYDKGVEGEEELLDIFRDSGEFIVEDTHGTAHKGDCVLRRGGRAYCIDSKKHSHYVPHADVSKLIHDIELNDYDGGAIIAWNAGIYDPSTNSKIKSQIYYKKYSSKPILFLSNASDLPKRSIIALITCLEDYLLKSDKEDSCKNYEKLNEKMMSIADEELKKIETRHNSLQRQMGQNNKERQRWNRIKSEHSTLVDSP